MVITESKRCTVEEITEMLKSSGLKADKGGEFTLSVVRGIQYRTVIEKISIFTRVSNDRRKSKEVGNQCKCTKQTKDCRKI